MYLSQCFVEGFLLETLIRNTAAIAKCSCNPHQTTHSPQKKVNGGSFRLGFIAIKISVKHRGIIVIMSSMHIKLKVQAKALIHKQTSHRTQWNWHTRTWRIRWPPLHLVSPRFNSAQQTPGSSKFDDLGALGAAKHIGGKDGRCHWGCWHEEETDRITC